VLEESNSSLSLFRLSLKGNSFLVAMNNNDDIERFLAAARELSSPKGGDGDVPSIIILFTSEVALSSLGMSVTRRMQTILRRHPRDSHI
jgi:hypothetical protein